MNTFPFDFSDSLENSLSLSKHEQDFEFFQSRAKSGTTEPQAPSIKAKIDHLRGKKLVQPETPSQIPQPVAVVNEIPKKR